ncbi:MAG: hypothetical protein J5544_00095 [Clostridia bacterium]|nr:hypothetical protein [Clostridia bacterium]
MIKKTALLLLACLFLFSACAGKGTEDADAPGGTTAPGSTDSPGSAPREDDFDNRFGQGCVNLAETEDAYYFSPPNGNYIYYHDKQAGDYGVLCAKPECLHDEGNEKDCSGLAFICMKALNNWGGKLHFVGWDDTLKKYCLFGLSYDGSEREREAVLDYGEYTPLQIPNGFDYHRGMLYCFAQYETVTGGVPGYATELFSMDPETGKLTRFFAAEDDAETRVGKPKFFCYNQYVYFLISKWYFDENVPNEIELRRYDTETEQVEDVYCGVVDPQEGCIFRYWVESEDRIYLMPDSCRSGNTPKLYLISGGEMSLLHEFDMATGEYGVETVLFEGAIAFFAFRDERLKVCAYDGTVICDGPLDLSPLRELGPYENADIGYYEDIYGDSTELFVSYIVPGPSGRSNDYRYCLVRYTFREGGAEAKLLVANARGK